jgi:hypothetical protein
MDVLARLWPIAEVAADNFSAINEILKKAMKLVPKRVSGSEEIP